MDYFRLMHFLAIILLLCTTAVVPAVSTELWRFATNEVVWSRPRIWKDAVLIASMRGKVAKVAANTGEVEWSVTVDEPIRGAPLFIESVKCVVLTSLKSRVRCISWNDGGVIWAYTHSVKTWIFTPQWIQRHVVVGTRETGLLMLHPKNGTLTGSIKTSAGVWAPPAFAPSKKRVVFAVTANAEVFCYSWNGLEKLWSRDIHPSKSWKEKVPHWIFSELVVVTNGSSEIVVFGANDHTLRCLNVEDGKMLWSVRLRGKISTKVIVLDSILVAVTESGVMYAIRISSGTIQWTLQPTKSEVSSNAQLIVRKTEADEVLLILGYTNGEVLFIDPYQGQSVNVIKISKCSIHTSVDVRGKILVVGCSNGDIVVIALTKNFSSKSHKKFNSLPHSSSIPSSAAEKMSNSVSSSNYLDSGEIWFLVLIPIVFFCLRRCCRNC